MGNVFTIASSFLHLTLLSTNAASSLACRRRFIWLGLYIAYCHNSVFWNLVVAFSPRQLQPRCCGIRYWLHSHNLVVILEVGSDIPSTSGVIAIGYCHDFAVLELGFIISSTPYLTVYMTCFEIRNRYFPHTRCSCYTDITRMFLNYVVGFSPQQTPPQQIG
jgi:hypothetical protein